MQKARVIPKELLEPIKLESYNSISRKLGETVAIVKKSLVKHGMYRGKFYTSLCEGCGEVFSDIANLKNIKFCSNECRHKFQKIWSRGLTKNDSPYIMAASNRITEYNKSDNYNRQFKLTSIILPKSKIEISYDPQSTIEYEWLVEMDSKPGFKNITRFENFIEYYDELQERKRKFYPDFVVEWETGVKWLVEIKGIIKNIDLDKFKFANEWCRQNGFIFRLVTEGLIKKDSWRETYTHTAIHKSPSPEWIFMQHAVVWSSMSCSNRLKVGAVIASEDYNNILSVAYNGDEKGGGNIPCCELAGQENFLHAEENALLKISQKERCKLFITHAPCEMCAKRIINFGSISEVYYLIPYRDTSGSSLLISAGIPCYKFSLVDFDGREISEKKAIELMLPSQWK